MRNFALTALVMSALAMCSCYASHVDSSWSGCGDAGLWGLGAPHMITRCDAEGEAECARWIESFTGVAAITGCTFETPYCQMGNRCEVDRYSMCRCGDGPACTSGICFADHPGGTPTCHLLCADGRLAP